MTHFSIALGNGCVGEFIYLMAVERFQFPLAESILPGQPGAVLQEWSDAFPLLAAAGADDQEGRLGQFAEGVIQPLESSFVRPLEVVQEKAKPGLGAFRE